MNGTTYVFKYLIEQNPPNDDKLDFKLINDTLEESFKKI